MGSAIQNSNLGATGFGALKKTIVPVFIAASSLANAAPVNMTQGAQCALYKPMGVPAGSVCLTGINTQADPRMICVTPENGPVLTHSDSHSPSSTTRGYGYASAANDYNKNIAVKLNDNLEGFKPAEVEDDQFITMTLEDGRAFDAYWCGDATITTFTNGNGTESTANEQYKDLQQAVAKLISNKDVQCACPMTQQLVQLSAGAKTGTTSAAALGAALLATAFIAS